MSRHISGHIPGHIPQQQCASQLQDTPIHVRVNKPGIPDLTLIDLPGITRNPVGDQPDNIEELIKSMISKYIEGESKVILCVMPADQDFTTCEVRTLDTSHDVRFVSSSTECMCRGH